jgi:hypothetical protein
MHQYLQQPQTGKQGRFRKVVTAAVLAGALAMSAAAQAADRHVVVYNRSSYTMQAFYASNINRGSWEEDILGRLVVPSGRRERINIDDGSGHCRYDLKAVFSGGVRVVKYHVNVCAIGSWTIYD